MLRDGLDRSDQSQRRLRIFERLVDDRSGHATVELDGHRQRGRDLRVHGGAVLGHHVPNALSLVLGHGVGDELGQGVELGHVELQICLQVEERLDSLDVDRCAESAAQREDECGHGAALLITWRYVWRYAWRYAW